MSNPMPSIIDRIRSLYGKATDEGIAFAMKAGITRQFVHNLRNADGVAPFRKHMNPRKQIDVSRFDPDKSDRFNAMQLGCSRVYIRRLRRRSHVSASGAGVAA